MPAISVILPVFNAADTILRAVQSIQRQTFRELELIVIDDGSTDDTAARVRAAERHDSRIRLLVRPRQGVAAAANCGLDIATAPLVARMDADDVSDPDRLRQQLAWLEQRRLDAVGCQVRILGPDGTTSPALSRYQRWINQETLESDAIHALRFVELPLVNPSILARRQYFALRFEKGDFPEDYDLFLRAVRAGLRMGKVPSCLFDWWDGPQRLTRNSSRYSRQAFERCRRRHLLAGPLQTASELDLWGVGATGKPWLRWLLAQKKAVRRAYDVNPRKIGRTIHGTTVTHPDAMPISDGTPLVIAVGADGARQLINDHLRTRDYVAGRDAWFVA